MRESRVIREKHFDLSEYTHKQAVSMIAEATKEVQSSAKLRAPVDMGNLMRSISSEVSGLTGIVFAGAEYAPYQEYGTYKMKAQPFLRPALDEVSKRLSELWRRGKNEH